MKSSVIPRKLRVCSVDGCTSWVHGKGMCSSHRYRMRRYGHPTHDSGRTQSHLEVERLWSRLRTPDAHIDGECWEWPGSRNRMGYGTTKRQGENIASRAAWVEVNGAIPTGLLVCHKCDNPPCVRPSHLFLGEHRDNSADKLRKGRDRYLVGQNNHRATLSNDQVRDIRSRSAGGESYKALARQYGVHPVTVSRICRRLRRGDLRERVAREAVAQRSGGVCEVGGEARCARPATEWHHRRNRSQGGQWVAANGLHLCRDHHAWIGDHPQRAYALGWLVPNGVTPDEWPVRRFDEQAYQQPGDIWAPSEPHPRQVELGAVA